MKKAPVRRRLRSAVGPGGQKDEGVRVKAGLGLNPLPPRPPAATVSPVKEGVGLRGTQNPGKGIRSPTS